MKLIDLRSDTVTRPTAEMLDQMFGAIVGDDVFGEDPATNTFQEEVAAYFGKEAALFFPSGTMANQVAINAHTSPGDEVICHQYSHVYLYEGGGIARNSGCSIRPIANPEPVLTPAQIAEVLNPDVDWMAKSKLVVAEDTSNRGGGACYELDQVEALSQFCREKNLSLHLDGARVFNAIVAKNHNPVSYASNFDSISICFSKGLGAPVGSVLAGTKKFISQVRRIRKVFGGGMRQTGYLAAACSYALHHNVQRLQEDHSKAAALAEALSGKNWVKHVVKPETNIVIFETAKPALVQPVLKKLELQGILATEFGTGKIRMVTHLDIDGNDLEAALQAINNLQPLH